MELTQAQIWILGLISSVVVLPVFALIKKLAVKINPANTAPLGKGTKTVVVAVVAAALSAFWFPDLIPNFPDLKEVFSTPDSIGTSLKDLVAWVQVVVTSSTPFVGSATLIYNVVLGNITDPTRRSQLAQSFVNFWK